MADLSQIAANLPKEKQPLAEKIKLVATVVGILSPIVALATFIGLKPEKRKALEWEYLSISSLVNTNAATSEKVEVSYEGRRIKQLSVVTARLRNSGAVPIDSSDVKDIAYPTVEFGPATQVIGVEIKSKAPEDLRVSALPFLTNSVRIEHGLLNPSDSVTVQILLEGKVGDISSLPPVRYRISGINTPQTKFPMPAKQQAGVAFFQMRSLSEFLILALASVVPIVMLVASPFLFFESLRANNQRRHGQSNYRQ